MNRNWCGLRGYVVFALIASTTTQAQVNQNPGSSKVKTGVLLLAHGGRLSTWNDEVRRISGATDNVYPTEVAFGMATKSSIQEAVDRLAARGVKEIVAVPLFVSSWSSVIASTEWLLGLRSEMPEDYKMFAGMSHGHEGHADHNSRPPSDRLTPIKNSVPVRMTSALNRHPIVADILTDRAASISTDPKNELVVLVAHGPNPEEDNIKWLADLKLLAELVAAKAPYHRVEYLTIRDDAEEPVAAKAKAEFRSVVEKAKQDGRRALVVPVLLSYGGIENRLRDRLKGLDFTMPNQGLLPDTRIVDWVLATVRATAQ